MNGVIAFRDDHYFHEFYILFYITNIFRDIIGDTQENVIIKRRFQVMWM